MTEANPTRLIARKEAVSDGREPLPAGGSSVGIDDLMETFQIQNSFRTRDGFYPQEPPSLPDKPPKNIFQ